MGRPRKPRSPEEEERAQASYLPAGLGEQFRAARNRRGWTVTELSQRAGVSTGAISKVETGTPVKRSTLEDLAAALGVELEVGVRLRWTGDATRRELLEAAESVPERLQGTAARILRTLPHLPSDHLEVLLSWIALHDPARHQPPE